ncbi:peptidyl-prolyl cis-trans isomerase [Planococcus sp. CP5-4]|uniref:peptidyl-prolyl cis-trans isomerase n=1 Tax=unclassified Planococcus (in: firmicutes) TaxID=2662419 RepID=UPI001C237258|nr:MULTISPECIES: peptidyl-prolyl cis-trans isomerase [unclassified Planococcus (in: firmicutes)]MBU9674675.1 peptidyl-prolyl cis-trans isomerase [Planococcus sp. CP5-4_YE]MBV0910416.1 peptidyl-prolyl cis-trans isomerase [Planococcus sp. CP5-4_UN]MBW6064895.1 peptidyl-prolyl cis-trans isomerase [Planococcus sp. CP5-4]
MNSNRNNTTPLKQKRHLKTKPVLMVIGILLLANVLWFIAWLIPNGSSAANEEVAAVDGEEITRAEWMASMEQQHGRSALLELVNEKVMAAAADDYGIEVSDKEIDLELAMMRTAQDGTEELLYASDSERQRDKVKAQLILEKVLTKDVLIEDQAIEDFYEDNRTIYDVKDSYRTSMIVLNSKAEAEETIKELDNGSSFEALARERSIDNATGNLGGDIGFVSPGQASIDPQIAQTVESIEPGSWSAPLALEDGRTAVIMVKEKIEGRTFDFDEVKEHISRELALEQLPQSVSPEAFWQEFDAEWFYGEGE